MQISEEMIDDVLVLHLEGELMGGSETEVLRRTIEKSIEKEAVDVVVDLDKVRWMNSSGLGMLISALTSLRSSGGDLRLANLNERSRRPIQITRLDQVFQEFDSIESAVNSFK
ncbi:STAS domain-containing protein [candidate division KSB1 bacterium]|nr:STAS domain-containing protein [candidate division KSB1 bacterium]